MLLLINTFSIIEILFSGIIIFSKSNNNGDILSKTIFYILNYLLKNIIIENTILFIIIIITFILNNLVNIKITFLNILLKSITIPIKIIIFYKTISFIIIITSIIIIFINTFQGTIFLIKTKYPFSNYLSKNIIKNILLFINYF